MQLNKLLDDFLSYIKHEENLSPNTVYAYKNDLSGFVEYLLSKGVDSVKILNHVYIRTYLSSLFDRLDKKSIARKTSAIRTFLRYLNMQGFVTAEILSKLSMPKIPQKLMFALSLDEINVFLSVIDTSTDIGKRNLAILELLYGAGLRVSELAGLKIYDLDFEQKNLKVLGKGRKERIVPFNTEAVDSLKNYLNARNNFLKQDKPNDYVFLNKSGSPLHVRSIQRLLVLLSKKTGILKNATPHTIRHSYATHLLEAGASIKTVKELLGHVSIAATQRYTHITTDKLMEMYKKAHPKA